MSILDPNIMIRPLEDVLPEAFLGYSKHVILQRAIPDVRDGLKPVHRRILYSMSELNMTPDKPYSKSARLVGDCMGKYHPHGDSSIYEAAVRMAQPWATRYPFVDGHGNFGSIDGDGAAAMRYTEMRMTPLSLLMCQDIDKDTVDYIPNYDNREKEPAVLPSPFPNLLINGGSGIAVGMASNMPPHNLKEVCEGVIAQINNPHISVPELMSIIPGPDFPTGGHIIGKEGIVKAYQEGRGKITLRGKAVIEPSKGGRSLIVITEIPYQVNKAKLAEKIEELAEEKIDGIYDVRDESDREGMRLVVEVRKDSSPEHILRLLYKNTQLQETFGIINLVIRANGSPAILGLKDIIQDYIDHRRIVVRRRTEFDLNKAKAKAHILEGLVKALDNIDEVIQIIKEAKNPSAAKAALILRFEFTEIQAQAILDMRLQHLTNMEVESIQKDYASILKLIAELEELLASPAKIDAVLKTELKTIAEQNNDRRCTSILVDDSSDDDTDVIEADIVSEPVNVFLNDKGFIRRESENTRKGRSVQEVSRFTLNCTTNDTLYFFTDSGKFYTAAVSLVPEMSAKEKGRYISNVSAIPNGSNIVSLLAIPREIGDKWFIFVTVQGQVLKSPVSDFSHARTPDAIGLKDGDQVVRVFVSDGAGELFVATARGQSIRFKEDDISIMGRKSKGVRGVNLQEKDRVVSALYLLGNLENSKIISVTERGYVKQSMLSEYPLQNRGGKGVALAKIDLQKTGLAVGICLANGEGELSVILQNDEVQKIDVSAIKVEARAKVGSPLVTVLLQNTVKEIVL